MTLKQKISQYINGHRIAMIAMLCLFGLGVAASHQTARKRSRKVQDDRVHLVHSDQLSYDIYGPNPEAQIVKGRVHFNHAGAQLFCDSAYYYQESNSFKAFGHVRFRQGDTLSLTCDYGFYDGQQQLMEARRNVVLKHQRQTLYTDSLDYDRLYEYAYFREGGTLIDGKDKLVSDWGEYNTKTREATFYYNVKLRSGKRLITTDTLYYDTRKSLAHIVGPSKITSGTSVIHTEQGYFDTQSDKAQLFGRSTVVDKEKTITGDSLYYDDKTGISRGFGNVVFVDQKNKTSLTCGKLYYNEKTGYGLATKRAVSKEYSRGDTLYAHADTMKLFTFHINTDSVYRKVHYYPHVRAYRTDVQAVCDSMVFNSQDSCMTMYKDPIVWNAGRQLLGEVIKAYMADSTIREAHVLGQALSIEQMPDSIHYNQIASRDMFAYFKAGALQRNDAIGNVQSIYYTVDDKDSSLIGLNYLETDTMRMFLNETRKLEKIWTCKFEATLYPMTQIPPDKTKLTSFAWFNNIRPKNKEDIFVWRGKGLGANLQTVKRQQAPLQTIERKTVIDIPAGKIVVPKLPQKPKGTQR